MADPVVVIEGAQELRAVLRKLADRDLVLMLRDANRRAADIVVKKAEPHVPVRTGRLKASLRATGSQRFGEARAGSARVPYAAAVHWGRKVGNVGSPPGNRQGRNVVKGNPFLWNAIPEAEAQIIGEYTADIRRVIAAIGLKVQ